MRLPTAFHTRLLTATLFALLPWLPPSAHAQSTTFGVQLWTIEGRTDTRLTTPLNIAECSEDVEITVRANALPTAAGLDIYYGQACEISTNRLATSTTKQCEQVAWVPITNQGGFQDITFNVSKLGCTQTATRKIFFLPVESDGAGGEVTNFVTLDISIDATPPAAPTGIEGGQGESTIPVSWMFTGTDVNEFIVYWDPDDTTCMSPKMEAGDEDLEGLGLGSKTVNQTTRNTTVSNAVAVGQRATVGVVAVDLAGNTSPLSTTACLEGVETTSWRDLHEAQGGKSGNTCSVGSLTAPRASTLLLWCSAIAVFLVHARRRIS